MNRRLLVSLIVCVVACAKTSVAGTTGTPLFRAAQSSEVPLAPKQRAGSAFIAMDASQFEALASWKDFICVIPNFPLATEGPVTLRVEQFEAVTPDVKGKYPVPKHVFLRGSVDGFPESHVCLTLFYNRAWGYINIGDKSYAISAAGRMESGELILGVIQDTAIAPPINCGTKDWNAKPPQSIQASGNTNGGGMKTLSSTVSQLTVSLEMDYPLVQKLGGTDTGAFEYGLSVIAAASDQYMRDAHVSLLCSAHYEWTTPDPYPDTQACWILDYFDGSYESDQSPSMHVLLSGRNADWCGGLAADIGVLCQEGLNKCVCSINHTMATYPYTQWTWDVMVSAHETGHLVACAHTHNCYFYPGGPIDSCVAAEGGDCYDTPVPSKGTIMSYCHTTSAGAILRFHPKCVTFIVQDVQQASCKTVLSIPSTSVSPTRKMQTCESSSSMSVTASGGTAPYTFEIDPAPVSMSISGNTCNFTAKPAKNSSVFYVRVTDAESVRTYDSVVFIPGTFATDIVRDSVSAGKDSMVLNASAPNMTGATCAWYKVPTVLGRSVGSGWQVTVARPVSGAGAVDRYYAKIISGTCSVSDTTSVGPYTAVQQQNSVAEQPSAQFQLYPNPAHDRITAIVPDDGSRFWIADGLGRRIEAPQTRSEISLQNSEAQQIDFVISQLPAGAYWLVRETGGTTSTASFEKW